MPCASAAAMRLAVRTGRALARQAHHQRLARAVDVGVEQADRARPRGPGRAPGWRQSWTCRRRPCRTRPRRCSGCPAAAQLACTAWARDLPVDFDADAAIACSGRIVARSRPRARRDSAAPETRARAAICSALAVRAAGRTAPGRAQLHPQVGIDVRLDCLAHCGFGGVFMEYDRVCATACAGCVGGRGL